MADGAEGWDAAAPQPETPPPGQLAWKLQSVTTRGTAAFCHQSTGSKERDWACGGAGRLSGSAVEGWGRGSEVQFQEEDRHQTSFHQVCVCVLSPPPAPPTQPGFPVPALSHVLQASCDSLPWLVILQEPTGVTIRTAGARLIFCTVFPAPGTPQGPAHSRCLMHIWGRNKMSINSLHQTL